ncbi:MAG TPA: hypothetical protein VIV27_02740 [Halioglobus sp.]
MIKLTVSKRLNIAFGGMLATMVLLSGCDRPRDEPATPNPDVPPPQQKMTEASPGQARSQEQYAEQLRESVANESPAFLL